MAMGSHLSVITLNVNGLNAPTKRQRLAEWIQKQDPYICCLQETHLKTGDTYRLKVKGWKKIFHAAFNICSLCLIFVNLINMCLGVFRLGFILFGTLWVSWTRVIISFPILGKFSTIISSSIFYGLSFCLLLLGLL